MSKLSDFNKQKAAAQRRADKLREKQSSPEYKAKQLEKQREATLRQQQKQRDKQRARWSDPEYRQAQLDKAKAKQKEQRVNAQQAESLTQKTVKDAYPEKLARQREEAILKHQVAQQRQRKKQIAKRQEKLADPEYRQQQLAKVSTTSKKGIQQKPVDITARRAKQIEAVQRQQQRHRDKQQALLQDPEHQALQREKVLAKAKARPVPSKPIKSKGLKGRARTAEEKRLEALLARIGCICCRNQGWYTDAMNNQEGQHFISMHHVDGRTKPWCHAKQLPLCQYHHDTPPPQGAPEQLFPLHGTGRKRWEKVNGTQEDLLQQVYEIIGEVQPWLQADSLDEELV